MTKIPEDEPLDPVLENVRRRLMRSMAWSIGILMMGLLVLMGAIVYKINQSSEDTKNIAVIEPSQKFYQEEIKLVLPEGAKIISSELDENRLKLHLETNNGDQEIRILDLQSGKTLSRIRFN